MTLIRGPRNTDQPYVASTWVRSASGAGRSPLGPRGHALERHVDAVMDRKDSRVLIRHAPGDPDAILGYVVFVEGVGVPVIHYTYVRGKSGEFRERGIATELLHAAGARTDKALVYTCELPERLHAGRKLRAAYPLATHLPLDEFLKPPETKR